MLAGKKPPFTANSGTQPSEPRYATPVYPTSPAYRPAQAPQSADIERTVDTVRLHVDGMTFLKALRCFEMNELFARPPHVKVHTAHSEARSLVRQGRIADADYYEKGLHGTTRLLSDLEAMICRNDSRPSAG